MSRIHRAAFVFGVLAAVGGCVSTPLPISPYPEGAYGVWAVSEDACADGWWRFTPGAIETAGETVCSVDAIFAAMSEPPSATYKLTCLAEGEPSQPEWSLVLEGRHTLVIDRNDGRGPLSLRRCLGVQ